MSAAGSQSGSADDGYYSDDPLVEDARRPRARNKILGAVAFIVAGVFFLNTTLAANISINTGQGIEFGQGATQTTACSGATNLTVTPSATFINAYGVGAFYFSSVTVSNIPSSCNGTDFTLSAYPNSGNTPLALFNSTSTNAAIYNSAGTFQGESAARV